LLAFYQQRFCCDYQNISSTERRPMSQHEKIGRDREGSVNGRGNVLNEDGIALLTSLLILTLLALLAPLAFQSTVLDTKHTGKFKNSRVAFYTAEAGMEQAKAILRGLTPNQILNQTAGGAGATATAPGAFTVTGNFIPGTTGVGVSPTAYASPCVAGSNNKYSIVPYNNGTYYVRLCNNADAGSAINDTDSLVYIESVGVFKNNETKVLRVMVSQSAGLSLPGAVTMTSTGTNQVQNGGNSAFSGNPVLLNGNPDPSCAAQYGLATATADISHISLQGSGSITGLGPNTAVTGGSASLLAPENTYTLSQAQALYAKVVGSATIVNGTVNGATWGTDGAPQVTRIAGAADIKGNVSGSGILIIEGDTAISGNFNFHGLVMIGVQPGATQAQLAYSSGNATIIGGLVTGGTSQAQTQATGSLSITYSCAGLALASQAGGVAGGVGVVAWKEVN
jgi:Tfp pilus assembly protein PilX